MRALVIGLLMMPSAAWAGCANYTDGSLPADTYPAPHVSICYDGQCEPTTLDYECGNAHGAQLGFANGWKFSVSDEGNRALVMGRLVNFDKVSCKAVEDDGCGLLNHP